MHAILKSLVVLCKESIVEAIKYQNKDAYGFAVLTVLWFLILVQKCQTIEQSEYRAIGLSICTTVLSRILKHAQCAQDPSHGLICESSRVLGIVFDTLSLIVGLPFVMILQESLFHGFWHPAILVFVVGSTCTHSPWVTGVSCILFQFQCKPSSKIRQDSLNHFMSLWSETRKRRQSKFSASTSLAETSVGQKLWT